MMSKIPYDFDMVYDDWMVFGTIDIKNQMP